MKKMFLLIVLIVVSIITLGWSVAGAATEDTTTTVPQITSIDGAATVGVGATPVATNETGRVQYEVGTTQPPPTTEMVVSIPEAPPTPQMTELPETGPGMRAIGLTLLGITFVGFGWLLVKWANDRDEL